MNNIKYILIPVYTDHMLKMEVINPPEFVFNTFPADFDNLIDDCKNLHCNFHWSRKDIKTVCYILFQT